MNRSVKRTLLQLSSCILATFLLSLLARGPHPHDRRPSDARAAIAQLTRACDAFFEEYQALPLADRSAIDGERITTGKDHNIMPPLCPPGIIAESPKYQTFFDYKKAQNKQDGLLRHPGGTVELFDPWSNPYHVLLDYDYDGKLKNPFTAEVIKDRRVLAWSNGPDGKSGTLETNEDNIYSWK